MQLTSSTFGEALGLGQGRPYDFFLSLVSEDACYQENDQNEYTKHGRDMEPIIDEAYQLLTGNTTVASGFWLPQEDSTLHGLCGASPDSKILSSNDPKKLVGLVEYKAPVYRLYDDSRQPHGIPRAHMAQIQGQMSISGAPWCDFMAVCTKTKQLCLQRVYFNQTYWQYVSRKLRLFCMTLKDAKQRREKGQQFLNTPGVQRLKSETIANQLLPGETNIAVKNLLEMNSNGQYQSSSGTWMDFDFLMGTSSPSVPSLEGYEYECILREIDKKIKQGQSSNSVTEKR